MDKLSRHYRVASFINTNYLKTNIGGKRELNKMNADNERMYDGRSLLCLHE